MVYNLCFTYDQECVDDAIGTEYERKERQLRGKKVGFVIIGCFELARWMCGARGFWTREEDSTSTQGRCVNIWSDDQAQWKWV